MESNTASKASVTPPKGKATRSRADNPNGGTFLTPAMQWLLVVLAGIAIIGAILYFGRDLRSNTGGGHSGAPVAAVATVEFDAELAG